MSGIYDAAWQEWVEEARRTPVAAYCAARRIKLRAGDAGQPCPACGGRNRFSVNTRKNVWLCRVSGGGGDAIALAQHLDGLNFISAVEAITGRPPPGRDAAETPEARREREARMAKREADRIAEEARQARMRAAFREAERDRALDIWESGQPIVGTPAEAYLAKRRIRQHATSHLRFAPNARLWNESKTRVAYKGPAMLAAIDGADGNFIGVHITWIDLDAPKGKAKPVDPDTGLTLPAKKVRGSLKGGSIQLVHGGEAPTRYFIGEGIETTLSVYWALIEAGSPLVDGAEFIASVDLDNIGGKAKGRVAHPTKTTVDARGRVHSVMVPDATPAAVEDDWPLVQIFPSACELILIGDGDSDPFATGLALRRGAKRFSRGYPFIAIKLAMSREGADFNDMRMRAFGGEAT